MGRGKVQLKRIENKINRQVTFSKRRSGLLKKANEISILCNAEVALIVFSTKGKLFEYSTDACMDTILERYERRQCCVEKEIIATHSKSQGNCSLEHAKLKAKAEVLQRNQRNFMGEDLESFTIKELHSLEQQLYTALKLIRSRQTKLLCASIAELQKKGKDLQEQNTYLGKKINDHKHEMGQLEQQQNQPQNSLSFLLSQELPSLTIRSDTYETGRGERIQSNQIIPRWMLGHVNQ